MHFPAIYNFESDKNSCEDSNLEDSFEKSLSENFPNFKNMRIKNLENSIHLEAKFFGPVGPDPSSKGIGRACSAHFGRFRYNLDRYYVKSQNIFQ